MAEAEATVTVRPQKGALTEQQLLEELYALMYHVYAPGQLQGRTDYLTLALATKWQTLYNDTTPAPRPVYAAVVQNLSTDPLTLHFAATPGQFQPPTTSNGQGTVLNPASAAGQGGGSHTFQNIDLEQVWIIGATKGDAFTVEWFV